MRDLFAVVFRTRCQQMGGRACPRTLGFSFLWDNLNGGSQTGAYISNIFRKNRANILPGKLGLVGDDGSGLIEAFLGPIMTHSPFLCTSQPQGRAEIALKGAFWPVFDLIDWCVLGQAPVCEAPV